VSVEGKNFLIDSGPDFRQQMLRTETTSLEAILYTHQHNDHVAGLGDVRPFNFMRRQPMKVVATQQVEEDLKMRFSYIFSEHRYPGAPSADIFRISKDHPFVVAGVEFIPVQVFHGKMPVLGFRTGDFAYVTDIKTISDVEMKKLEGLSVLVLSALHKREHHSHINLEQALSLIEKLRPQRTYLTHISHTMGLQAEVGRTLPKGVFMGFDGLEIEV